MKRQKGVWITILCILVIGVSVTKMTSRFVTSDALSTLAADEVISPEMAGDPETAMARGLDRTVPGEGALAAESPAEAQIAPGAAAKQEVMFRAAPPSDQTDTGQTAGETAEYVALETVKSPLDPTGTGPGQNMAAADGAGKNSEISTYTAEEYKERLDQTASHIIQYREAAGSKGGSAYIASVYELDIWDNELNALYTLIRSRMDEKEIETLRLEELEWLKVRDAAADRAAAKANGQTSKDIAYTEAAASKTKSRCYELLEDYGDIIDEGVSETAKSAQKTEAEMWKDKKK